MDIWNNDILNDIINSDKNYNFILKRIKPNLEIFYNYENETKM